MSASWYDVLGVAPDASTEEIRSAWKDSIADLGPTDRRFALHNEAAGVLLDPEQRMAYDAELRANEESRALVQTESEPKGVPAGGPEHSAAAPESDGPADEEKAPFSFSTRLLAVLALLTLVVAGLAAVLHVTFDDPQEVEQRMAEARRAAESSVPKVVAYDYKFPERSHDQALRVLTGDLRKDYERIWTDAIAPNLEKSKATLTSTVTSSGLVRSSDEGDRVEVMTLLRAQAVNAEGTQDYSYSLTATMLLRDGKWLIEELDGWQPAGSEDPATSESPSGAASPSESPSQQSPSNSESPSPSSTSSGESGSTSSPSGAAPE